MNIAFLFDGRNAMDSQKMEQFGFSYHGLGK